MSDQVRLAKTLAQLGPERLAAIIASQDESSRNFSDLLELAEFLLRTKSIASRLAPLHRSEIETLIAGESSELLIQALLGDESGAFESARQIAIKLMARPEQTSFENLDVSYDSLESWRTGHSSAVSTGQFQLTAQSLGQTVLALRELVLSADRHWLRAVRNGLRKPDAVMFSEYIHFSPTEIQSLFGLAVSSGLIENDRERWVPSIVGKDWTTKNVTEALTWIYGQLEPDLSQLKGMETGTSVDGWLRGNFPLSQSDRNRVVLFGEFLALTEAGLATELLTSLLAGNLADLAKKLEESWPIVASRIVVQADQSLTIPGPLSPELHVELSRFADPLDIGLASRFRITQMSICRGLEAGLAKEAVTDRLVELSGSSLPQPVHYVIEDAARRLLAIRLQSANFGTEILFDDRIESIKVEREKLLQPVGFFRINELTLGSRLKPELILLALQEAGYPASKALVENRRKLEGLTIGTGGLLESEGASSHLLELAEQLIASGTPSADEHHLLRQLQSAFKNKIPITLTIRSRTGDLLSFTAIVTAVSDNRVRLRDHVADTERTIPLTSIVDWALG